MRITKPYEQALSSLINLIIVFLIFSLFLIFLEISLLNKKLLFISFFFTYKLIIIFFNGDRSIGMILTKMYWKENYPLKNKLIHAVLYTASFSTLLFWIWFPFDLFLINMLLIQLPTTLLTGTTFHSFLSGKMITVKKN